MTRHQRLKDPFQHESRLNLECLALKVFARFEFALKQCAPPFAKQQGLYLKIKHEEFARLLEPRFNPDRVSSEIRYLINNPPHRQELTATGLAWPHMAEAPTPVTFEWLMKAAYMVRNNLFHGGKSAPNRDVKRKRQLIAGALAVIDLSLSLCPELSRIYGEPAGQYAG